MTFLAPDHRRCYCCCSDFSDLEDVLLDPSDVVKNTVNTVHVIDGPVDPSYFTKMWQCQFRISQLSV